MALLTKTLTDFVNELESATGRALIGLTFKPVASGSPTRFIAVFGIATGDTTAYQVWDVGP